MSYLVVAVAAAALAIALAWFDGGAAFARAPLLGRVALAGIALLPLVQLMPLPPGVWQALSGQALRHQTLALAGLGDSWQPLTVEPVGTALSAVMAIGFVAFTGWVMRLGGEDFRRVLAVALVLVFADIAVGLLQVVGNGQPHIQSTGYDNTLLGFFANKNHMAFALACSILLFGLVVSRDILARERRRVAVLGYTAFALVALVTTNSRAGLGLGAIAAGVVLFDLFRTLALRWRLAALGALVVLAVFVAASPAFEQVFARVDDVSSDLRWRFTLWSLPLARDYALLGSGIGSFRTLFVAHEQLAWVKPTIVNAVHDDYLQLVIEAGVPGVAVLLALAASLAGAALTALRRLPARGERRQELVLGLVILVLVAIHSTVDYPLRRPAAWVFLALAIAAIYRARDAAIAPADRVGAPEAA